jgi:hypothetical protein
VSERFETGSLAYSVVGLKSAEMSSDSGSRGPPTDDGVCKGDGSNDSSEKRDMGERGGGINCVIGDSISIDCGSGENSSDGDMGDGGTRDVGDVTNSGSNIGDADGVGGSSIVEMAGEVRGVERDDTSVGKERIDRVMRKIPWRAIPTEYDRLHMRCGKSVKL